MKGCTQMSRLFRVKDDDCSIPRFRFAHQLDVGRAGRQTTIGRVGIHVDCSTRFTVVVKWCAYNQIGSTVCPFSTAHVRTGPVRSKPDRKK